jgi:hypothetical protein
MKKLIVLLLLAFSAISARSQVLITLLLGDKLNSDKIEFGLDGGVNYCNIANLDPADSRSAFNLGFYFDLKLNQHLMVHTGVIVKSTMGAEHIKPYTLNDVELDNQFADGSVLRKISYFHVPILLKYRFATYFHVEAGPMLGLRTKATDIFSSTVKEENDLTYKLDISDLYKRIDAGIMGGVGFKVSKALKSTQIGIRYFYSFVDALKDNPGDPQYNSALYLYCSIPIGVSKAAAEAAAANKK